MSLSDTTRFARFSRIVGGALLVALLAGCQVRPLYSTSSGTEGKLASISISDSKSRVEQQVRNELIFLFAGGAGEPQRPVYRMQLNVSSKATGVLINVTNDIPSAGRVTVSADYNLARTDTGETVASGRRSSVALVDFPVQEFAKLRAIRDAENRASRELAEMIRAEVASAIGRH